MSYQINAEEARRRINEQVAIGDQALAELSQLAYDSIQEGHGDAICELGMLLANDADEIRTLPDGMFLLVQSAAAVGLMLALTNANQRIIDESE